eukprot:gb/GECH01011348.1/.p1 GENE.gb/GECH01011348.1/~~gb/GECH01011348.1/.p1  ORF type:complete len:254 (+),score=18.93 gb/GECH01011348.1/:1-762(+)
MSTTQDRRYARQPARRSDGRTPAWVRAGAVQELYDVDHRTLHNWHSKSFIRAKRQTTTGHRYYHMDDVHKMFEQLGDGDEHEQRKYYCYARVSTPHQKADLERQIQELSEAHPDHAVISDVGSGLNWKRRGFLRLVDEVLERRVAEIVVAYPDRLCRFGFEVLQHICHQCGTRVVVLGEGSGPVSDQPPAEADGEHERGEPTELKDDLLSIITVFAARNNGRRAAQNRKRRRASSEASVSQSAEPPKSRARLE